MKKIAFLFPGQGAQYVGMGKDFYLSFRAAKDVLDEADDILHFKLSDVVFNGPVEDLNKTNYSQLGIFVCSIAFLKVLTQQMPNFLPFVCAGLSLGEYTALYAGGYISFKDSLKLIQKRAQFMTEACSQHEGTMAAILGLDDDKVETIVKSVNNVFCANYNCPGQIVISGSKTNVNEAVQLLKQNGAKVIFLKVEGAFHSPYMLSAKERLEEAIDDVEFKLSKTSIIMNFTGDIATLDKVKSNLVNQLIGSVRWRQSIEKMITLKVDMFLEIGCGKTLSSMNKKIGVKGEMVSLEKVEDMEKLKNLL